MKDGSEPRLALEVALLKTTQPSADQSLQALMFRIDQLEARLAGGGAAGGAEDADGAPAAADPSPPPRAPVPRAVTSGGGAAAAVADARAEPVAEAVAAPAIDLARVKEMWSAVAEAVREQNAMVAALVSEAVPSALEGDKLTVSFPEDAAFLKKKAEANRDLVLGALRTLTGRGLSVAFELSPLGPGSAPRTLGEEELLERLKREFGAEEVFDDPDTED